MKAEIGIDNRAVEATLPEKQLHLIRSAYKVMGQKGVSHLVLQDVADEANVSKAQLLYYFESKEHLILMTIRWVLEQVVARIYETAARAEGAAAKIEAMVDAIFISPQANRVFYLVFFALLGYASRVDEFGAISVSFSDICTRLCADLIALGVSERVFRVSDVAEAAIVVRSMINGLFMQWMQEKDWEDQYESYRALCKRSILIYLRAT